MLKVLRSAIIEAPIESVWDVLRDFNSHSQWHPAIGGSAIERGRDSDQVSCIRRFTLVDGQELREQLLSLSDLEMGYSYCLLDTPVPLFNYVAHVRLYPVTDTDHTYAEWEARFTTIAGKESEMQSMVGNDIFATGFSALRKHIVRVATAAL